MTALPTFTEVSQALLTLSSLGTAGESHGLLCALLSFNAKIREKAWVDSLLSGHIQPNDALAQKAYQCLTQLFRVTASAFTQTAQAIESFDFPILLPDDDLPLEERIAALAEWCQGYLTGLHLVGVNLNRKIDFPDLKEAVDDLLAISQLELSTEDQQDPSSEMRLIELVEHVKAAVLMVQTEFKTPTMSKNHRDPNTTIH